jgi:hypothetical protein
MRRGNLLHVGIGAVFGLLAAVSPCLGGSVTASAASPSSTTFNSTNGFMNVAAFSRQDGMTNASISSTVTFGGVNQTAGGGVFKNGVGLTSTTIFVPDGTTRIGLSGRPVPNGSFLGPVAQNLGANGFALTKNNLSAVNDIYAISSTTVDWIGTARVRNVGGAAKYALSAIASGGTAPGAAAARATDPVDIPTGSYTYDPDINMSLTIDPGESGDAKAYAVDAATFTAADVETYNPDDDPITNALWSLEMGGSQQSSNAANVEVDFELNPEALSELTFPAAYLSTLSYSTQAQEIAAIEANFDSTIMSDESFGGNTDTLTNVDPFPAGTMFSPAANNEEYNFGVDAEIEVPEPTAAVCLLALGACLLNRRPRRSNAEAA